MTTAPTQLLTVSDVAAALKRSRRYVLSLIRDGSLPAVSFATTGPKPSQYRINASALAEFVETRTTKAKPS